MNRNSVFLAALALIVAFGLGAGLWIAVGAGGTGVIGSGTALIGGPFTLTDQHGKRVSSADFRGRLMLVYFGYTYCPDVCPGELQAIGVTLDMLGKDADEVAAMFITVDPERDDVPTMAQYVPNFSDRLIGLTGTPQEIAAAAKAYRVYYAKVPPEREGAPYLMDHSSFAYLMGRDGAYIQHFSYGTAPQDMAAAIEKAL